MGKKFFINIIIFSLIGLIIDLIFETYFFKPIGIFLGAFIGYERRKNSP